MARTPLAGPGRRGAAGTPRSPARTWPAASLGFPGDRFLAYLIALGYPAGRPLAPLNRT